MEQKRHELVKSIEEGERAVEELLRKLDAATAGKRQRNQ
jgi:hypothetical protein